MAGEGERIDLSTLKLTPADEATAWALEHLEKGEPITISGRFITRETRICLLCDTPFEMHGLTVHVNLARDESDTDPESLGVLCDRCARERIVFP